MKDNEIKYEYEPHSFRKTKSLSWPICQHCGLVAINNGFTRWSVDKGCNSRYHPSYKSIRSKFSILK